MFVCYNLINKCLTDHTNFYYCRYVNVLEKQILV